MADGLENGLTTLQRDGRVTQPERDMADGEAKQNVVHRPTWFWQAMHLLCFTYFVPAYGYRCWGADRVPLTGPTLLVSNHQSFYDPIIVGLPMARRRFYALARKTLWDNGVVGGLIDRLGAIPVDQENPGDLKAMRACMELLSRGEAMLIFPEGARTTDGRTGQFQTGTHLLIKRAKPTVVPVAVDGAYDVWPRRRKLPRPTGRVGVMFGEPIAAESLIEMGASAALSRLSEQVESLRLEVAARLELSGG